MISKDLLIDDLISQRLIQTDDGAGGYEEDWADEMGFRGRISLLTTGERVGEQMISDRQGLIGRYKIYANEIGDMNETYRIRLKDNSRVFEVIGIEIPSNKKRGHYQISVKEIL